MIIKETFMELADKVNDWSVETFNSLKKRLHKNSPYKNDANINYQNTWNVIEKFTKKRRRKDIA